MFPNTLSDSLGNLLAMAKDIPTEKIAAVGLLLLGLAAIATNATNKNVAVRR